MPPSLRAIILVVPRSSIVTPPVADACRDLSCRDLFPASTQLRAPALVARRIPVTSTGMTTSNHLALAQIGDGGAVVAQLGEDFLRMLAEVRGRPVDHRRRARQGHRLVHHRHVAALGCGIGTAMPTCLTCGSANTWSMA